MIDASLWVLAILGLFAIMITVTATALGFRPMIVRSGSMEPSIPVGSVLIVNQVDSASLRVGDVISVERLDGIRVTHRIVGLEPKGDRAQVTLKGDANKEPDATPVTVDRAYRLVTSLPRAAWPAKVVATPIGGFMLGLLVAAALLVPRLRWQRSLEA